MIATTMEKKVSKTSQLSAREREIVGLASAGYTDPAIGDALGISASTVVTYWNRIRAKLGNHTRTVLITLVLNKENEQAISELQSKYDALLSRLDGNMDFESQPAEAADTV